MLHRVTVLKVCVSCQKLITGHSVWKLRAWSPSWMFAQLPWKYTLNISFDFKESCWTVHKSVHMLLDGLWFSILFSVCNVQVVWVKREMGCGPSSLSISSQGADWLCTEIGTSRKLYPIAPATVTSSCRKGMCHVKFWVCSDIENHRAVTHLLTYLRSWALLEKPPIKQPLKNFPEFYGNCSFITMFTRALPWSLSWARLGKR
jgi:hypothetical protein